VPRVPKLTELNPVKSAVRHRPELAVPAYLAICTDIGDFIGEFGGGPDSFYPAFSNAFKAAADHVTRLADPELQQTYIDQLQDLEALSADFGYGVDSEVGEHLEALRERLAEHDDPAPAGRRRRRGDHVRESI